MTEEQAATVKVGDIVRCIYGDQNIITNGQIYQVNEVYRGSSGKLMFGFTGNPHGNPHAWLVFRFEKVVPESSKTPNSETDNENPDSDSSAGYNVKKNHFLELDCARGNGNWLCVDKKERGYCFKSDSDDIILSKENAVKLAIKILEDCNLNDSLSLLIRECNKSDAADIVDRKLEITEGLW